MDSIRFNSLSVIEIIILIIVILIIIFIVLEPRISKQKLQNKNEHGSSKFADMKEISDTFNKEDIRNINHVGLPIWYEKNKEKFTNVYFDTKSPHWILIGSTGSGKSVTLSIPLSIHFAISTEKHSVIITDPKGELFQKTGKIFKDNGYDVITIDFRNPRQSTKINIMQPIIEEWKSHCHHDNNMILYLSSFFINNKISLTEFLNNKEYQEKTKEKYLLENYIIDVIKTNSDKLEKSIELKQTVKNLENSTNENILSNIIMCQNESTKYQAETNRLVISLANLIFTEKDTKDPFWINSAKQLFIGIVGVFLEDFKEGIIDENKINISSIKKFQNSSLIKENQTYLQSNINRRKYGSLSKDYLISILSSSENTYKSITAVFGEKMSIFDDLNVENITSTNEFNFTNLGRKPTVLYIIVPDEDRSYFQMVTIILGMIIKDLTKFANLPVNNGTLPVKVEWILDEFSNCPPIDSIDVSISVARSRGMRFFLFIQSFFQLEQTYGKEVANIIIDNAALCYLKTNSTDCAERIMKKLGRTTIETNSMSKSTDVMKIGANQTTSLMGKDLLNATEIMSLKYKTIIFPTVSNPIFRDTYLYSDIYPEYENYPRLERKVSILKRISENYYTVEQMRQCHEKKSVNETDEMIKEMERQYQQQLNNETKESSNKLGIQNFKNNSMEQVLLEIRKLFKDRIIEEVSYNDVFTFEISGMINKFDRTKLDKVKKNNMVFEIAKNTYQKKIILSVWSYDLEMREI